MLDTTGNWIAALFVGAAMIVYIYWPQFDEPSYDGQADYFSKYRPKFSTSHSKYRWARYGYVLTFLAGYLAFSFIPEIFFALLRGASAAEGTKSIDSPTIVPIVIAFAIINFPKTTFTKDIERRVRTFFHSVAQIPDGVRRAVSQVRTSDFNFDAGATALQSRRLQEVLPADAIDATVANLMKTDKIVAIWYRIGCLLHSLSEEHRERLGIDPIFFDSYQSELDGIAREHAESAERVRKHISAILTNPALLRPGIVNDSDQGFYDELRKLRERLYTFLACAVQSSVNTDIESASIIRMLGFDVQLSPQMRQNILGMAWLIFSMSFIAVMFVSVFTVYLTQMFNNAALKDLDVWREVFQIPEGQAALYLWSWTTAIYYAAAIIAAILFREMRISARQWSDINQIRPTRPLLNYVGPIIAGTICGCAALILIALTNGPGFHLAIRGLSDLQEAVSLTFSWYPLALVVSIIALWIADSNLVDDKVTTILLRSLCGVSAVRTCRTD